MVDVEVDVQDPQPVAPGPGDRQGRVVVDAEPGRPIRHRVMQPPARVLRVLDVAAQDRLDRAQRPTGDGRRRLVHAGERRAVAALADARLAEPVRVHREPLDDSRYRWVWHHRSSSSGGRLGREPGLGTDRPEQVDARAEPPGRQGMTRPEVEVGGPGPEDEEHRGPRYPAACTTPGIPDEYLRACRIRHRPDRHPRARAAVEGPEDAAQARRSARTRGQRGQVEASKAQAEIQAAPRRADPPDEQPSPTARSDRRRRPCPTRTSPPTTGRAVTPDELAALTHRPRPGPHARPTLVDGRPSTAGRPATAPRPAAVRRPQAVPVASRPGTTTRTAPGGRSGGG